MKLILCAVAAVVLAVAAGALYNEVWVLRLAERSPVPGKNYEVNGYRMHLYCTGEGSPTVILEGGLGDDFIYWQKVQLGVARATRICSYDRAGIGWSDPQPGVHDAKGVSATLHALLQAAGEKGPFVMVGGSAGGLYVRQYTADYPSDVAALVFVDASLPEQIRELPGAGYSREAVLKRYRETRWDWFKEASGWARLTGHCKGEVESGLEEYLPLAAAEACRPRFTMSWLGEWAEFWRSADEVAQANCCGDRPILIISQDPDRPKPGWSAAQIAAQPIWNSLQESLKRLSPHSRRIIARGSRHHVMVDRPDVVVRGIDGLVSEVRDKKHHSNEEATSVE